MEPGSSQFLRSFLAQSKIKYEAGMNDFVRRPALSIFEFAEWRLLKNLFKLDLFKSIARLIDHNIRDQRLRAWLKFPVLFLGAKPSQTPALYSLMNYADFELGTWYPEGGMWKLFDAFYQLALKRGVHFHFNEEVLAINVNDRLATSLKTKNGTNEFDYLIGAADYHHIDTVLLPEGFRQYSDIYWSKRKLAPSALIFYLGIKGRIKDLLHHNLFFDEEFEQHAIDIYDKKVWPAKPLFYVCVTSRSDDSVAPEGHENVFILIPLATGIADDDTQREDLFNMVLNRVESKTGCRLAEDIVFRRDYCVRDFVNDYHSFQGNAYGLSNTLDQTAILKPSVKHNKIRNLYFAGQLTHPGPGLPPSLISGETAANLVLKKILRGSN
ncbi:MAG: phytoene desaturase family protein [Saprospiraceae bacterium]